MQNNITNALLALLSNGIVKFTYRKVNGEIRNAVGTRNLNAARKLFGIEIPEPKTGRSNPTAYYDLERGGWRSFIAENIISINEIDVKDIKGIAGGRIVKMDEPVEVEIPVGIGVGIGFGIGGTKKGELPKREEKTADFLGFGNFGTPTDKGMPKFSAEDFAKMVAKYVVAELVERLK